MAVQTITPPAELAVTLAEFRRHLWNVYDGHDTDEELLDFIQSATEQAEALCGRKFIRRELRMDAWLGQWMVLPFGDFVGVTGWGYTDKSSNAVSGVLDEVRIRHRGGLDPLAEILLPFERDWKDGWITWRVGMADTPADLPADIRMAIKQCAAYAYNNRATAAQTGETGDVRLLPQVGEALLFRHRINLIPDY